MPQVKGTAMVGLVRFLRKERERALPLVPTELRHYLEGRVIESRWYPEEDLIPLVRVCAELVGGDTDETLEHFGRITAQAHLDGGIYSHLRADGDPHSIGFKAVALWSSQHDTGEVRMEIEEDRLASLRVEGYSHSSREMCLILTGYFQEFFDVSNLPNPRIKKRQCISDGDPGCEWELRWD
jgi:hypothetical protein